MVMISLGYSFTFGPESFGPKQILYSQNFENGALTNWTISSPGSWTANNTTPLAGSYSMFLEKVAWSYTSLAQSTAGWQDMQIIATVKTNALDTDENLTLWTYNGSVWEKVWSQEDVTAQTDTWNLGSTYNNNANFKVNFTCASNGGANERCWVDDFTIKGTKLGALRITNLTITPVNGSSVAMDQYSLFNVTATAQCNGGATGECGDVNASLYYNFTGVTPNRLVNTTAGETPFFVFLNAGITNARPTTYYDISTRWVNETLAYDNNYNDTTTYANTTIVASGTELVYEYNLISVTSGYLFYTWELQNPVPVFDFVRIYNWSLGGWVNLSIYPSSHNIQTNNTYITKDNGFISSNNYVNISFYSNGGTGSWYRIYDTYINYNYSSTTPLDGSNPQSCSQLLQGDNCTATWQVNATGTPGTQYWLNVSFNSESSYINRNDTRNFQINISSAGPATYAFTITVPGNNYSNSSATMPGGGNTIMNFSYNGTWGGSQSYVNASFGTSWQTSATPALLFTNLGTTALTWTIKMNNSLPSWVVLFANDTNAIPLTNAFVFTDSNSLGLSVAPSGTKSLWIYANFTGVTQLPTYENYTQLNHSSS